MHSQQEQSPTQLTSHFPNDIQTAIPWKKVNERRITTGSDNAPVQRAKQTRGSKSVIHNFDLISCFSSPFFFLRAADIKLSSHCLTNKNNNQMKHEMPSFKFC